ncbi:hypothetical protein H5410_013775 [Solanum commersonii]|uniref:Uncharacterized protein n=1 Tax=Solanum commersonii TaxID=4109 RepID=A0A9J5ZPG4_SOLCO|nr:hypothetical protein H5410_013775 [Solanum commersonii]
MERVYPYGQTGPISSPWIFGVPEFRHQFVQKLSCTSVKTLVMELVGPHGKIGLFSRSNELQNRCHFYQKISWTSVKTLAIESVGPHG